MNTIYAELFSHTELEDVQPVLEHLCKRRLKLEQEALYNKSQLGADVHPLIHKTR